MILYSDDVTVGSTPGYTIYAQGVFTPVITYITDITTEVINAYDKETIDTKIGDIEEALDRIIEIQNSLIGGNA